MSRIIVLFSVQTLPIPEIRALRNHGKLVAAADPKHPPLRLPNLGGAAAADIDVALLRVTPAMKDL